MNAAEAAQRAIEWLELQLKELTGIRNATARDPSFKNWRQATLTVMQRIWPGDQGRCERFRRIPFSPADPRADMRLVREQYSRGCQEAARVLAGFINEIRANGVPEAAGNAFPEPQASEFEDGFPTVDLPAGDLGSSTSTADLTDNILAELGNSLPQGSEPGAPAPQSLQFGAAPPPSAMDPRPARKGLNMKARLKDLLGFAHLSAKALTGFPREMSETPPVDPRDALGVVPLGDDVSLPPAPPPPPPAPAPTATAPQKPVWPMLQPPTATGMPPAPPYAAPPSEPVAEPDPSTTSPSMIMTRPTTLRSSIEKVTIESLISPTFRSPGADEPVAEAAPSEPAGTTAWPTMGSAPTPEPVADEPVATPPAAPARPALTLVPPVFNDPEFTAGPPSGEMKRPTPAATPKETPAPSAKKPSARTTPGKVVPLPSAAVPPPPPETVAEPELTATDAPAAKVDSEAFARATEDFMRSSPVLGATGRPVQRGFEDLGFGDADAICVAGLVDELERMGVPAGRQPEVRARLLDLSRRLESGELEWSALRRAVWFVMEYPELARRVMPVLLPWIDRVA